MKSDKKGCSQCQQGQEKYESYWSHTSRQELIQYDYRHIDGKLFSCIAPTLEIARKKRDNWLKQMKAGK